MKIVEFVIAVIGIAAVLLLILAFADLYAGEWETVSKNVAPVIIAIVAFCACCAGIAYWSNR